MPSSSTAAHKLEAFPVVAQLMKYKYNQFLFIFYDHLTTRHVERKIPGSPSEAGEEIVVVVVFYVFTATTLI